MDEKRTVFRMRSINDNTLKAFFNDEVYASSPLYFNDPYDNNGVVGYPRTLVEKRHAAQHSMALGVLKR